MDVKCLAAQPNDFEPMRKDKTLEAPDSVGRWTTNRESRKRRPTNGMGPKCDPVPFWTNVLILIDSIKLTVPCPRIRQMATTSTYFRCGFPSDFGAAKVHFGESARLWLFIMALRHGWMFHFRLSPSENVCGKCLISILRTQRRTTTHVVSSLPNATQSHCAASFVSNSSIKLNGSHLHELQDGIVAHVRIVCRTAYALPEAIARTHNESSATTEMTSTVHTSLKTTMECACVCVCWANGHFDTIDTLSSESVEMRVRTQTEEKACTAIRSETHECHVIM